MLVRDLAAVRAAAAAAGYGEHAEDDPADAAGAAGAGELAAALEHATARIAVHHRLQLPPTGPLAGHLPARLPAPGPGPLPGTAPDAAAYLRTVSWWGPAGQHLDLAELLHGLFYAHEADDGLRHGYDPFGRLVVYAPAAHALGVAWPLAPDGARGLDLTNPAFAFTELPDGRVDLIPLDHPRPRADNAEPCVR
ncbi:hypothetical protein [Actinomadura sp. 21ATH]|uniref:hypothetical protein n=1 Tax=Actinomadura sp. 21ATH TaxID=1735444 RepID=UPI0035C22092